VTYAGVVGPATGCVVLACTVTQLNEPVMLRNAGGPLDLSSVRTIPVATLDIVSVTLKVEAVAGLTSSTAPLGSAPPSQPPPQGDWITGVTMTPVTAVLDGHRAGLE